MALEVSTFVVRYRSVRDGRMKAAAVEILPCEGSGDCVVLVQDVEHERHGDHVRQCLQEVELHLGIPTRNLIPIEVSTRYGKLRYDRVILEGETAVWIEISASYIARLVVRSVAGDETKNIFSIDFGAPTRYLSLGSQLVQ